MFDPREGGERRSDPAGALTKEPAQGLLAATRHALCGTGAAEKPREIAERAGIDAVTLQQVRKRDAAVARGDLRCAREHSRECRPERSLCGDTGLTEILARIRDDVRCQEAGQ